jgi:chaperone modulatory protein CbpM
MSLPDKSGLTGEILEDGAEIGTADLTRMFAVERPRIVEWVEQGVIETLELDAAEWRFSGTQLRRVRIALRLERDLGVNAAGVALALELLEELQQLRRNRRMGP